MNAVKIFFLKIIQSAEAIWYEVHVVLDDTATSRRQYAVFNTCFLSDLFI